MHKAEAVISLPAGTILPAITGFARTQGAEVEEQGGITSIATSLARITLTQQRDGLGVVVTSEDLPSVDGIVELFGSLLGSVGQPEAIRWAPRGPTAKPKRPILARVEAVATISPSFRRIRLSGDFSRFLNGGLHFRLLFGPEGTVMPGVTEGGEIDWPGGPDAWHRPPYTIRKLDPEGRWMDVDIFIHEGGRVTEWVEGIPVGRDIALIGPGGRGVRQAGWLGLVGDETALPVILRALEGAGPDTCGQAYILVPEAADRQPVDLPPGLSLTWVLRSEGRSLIDIFRALEPPEGDRFLMFAGERQDAALARDHAKGLGLAQGEFHAAAYWTDGWVPPPEQRQLRRS